MAQFANWIFFTMVVLSVMVADDASCRTGPGPYTCHRLPVHGHCRVVVLMSSVFVINMRSSDRPRSSLIRPRTAAAWNLGVHC